MRLALASFVALAVMSGSAQTPPTATTEVYRALLADASCNGRGRLPERNTLVVYRDTEVLTKPWWWVAELSPGVELADRIQQWFPQITMEEVRDFFSANARERQLPDQLIKTLGVTSVEEHQLEAFNRNG